MVQRRGSKHQEYGDSINNEGDFVGNRIDGRIQNE